MSRYNDTRIKQNKDLNRVYSYTMYPRIPIKNSDVFITPAYGTRLDLLANEYYKDSSLWWIIAQKILEDNFVFQQKYKTY